MNPMKMKWVRIWRELHLLDELFVRVANLQEEVDKMGTEVQDLQNGVTAISGSVQNAVNVLNSVVTTLKAYAQNPDPAAMETATSTLSTLAVGLQSAVDAVNAILNPPASTT